MYRLKKTQGRDTHYTLSAVGAATGGEGIRAVTPELSGRCCQGRTVREQTAVPETPTDQHLS
jgi:hypothetical protein